MNKVPAYQHLPSTNQASEQKAKAVGLGFVSWDWTKKQKIGMM
jgi:hypothetical protein